MKFILVKILSLILLTSAHAFQYEPENLSFSQRSYNLYIRPQFKNLIQDYQALFKLISIDNKFATENNALLIKWHQYSYELNSNCMVNISSSRCKKLNEELYTLIKKTLVYTEKLSRNLPFSQITKVKRINELALKVYAVEDVIEKIKTSSTKKDNEKDYTILAKKITEFKEKMQEVNLYFLPSIYREYFNLVEINFFIPVIQNFISDDKHKNLYTMTKDLNKSFHYFLMEMLKKGKPIPPAAKPLLEVMQRRWNSILKIVVKN